MSSIYIHFVNLSFMWAEFKIRSLGFQVPGSRFQVPGSKFQVPGSILLLISNLKNGKRRGLVSRAGERRSSNMGGGAFLG